MPKLQKRRLCSFESLESRLPFAIANDPYEPNNTIDTAVNVGQIVAPVTISGLTMNDGSDWFQFELTSRMALYSSAQISFLASQGDLDLYLYTYILGNPDPVLVGGSAGYAGSESILLYRYPLGTYYLNVVGYNGATNPSYKLSISGPAAFSTGGVGSYTDLVGVALSVTNPSAQWSQYITVNSQVRNIGTKASTGSFRVQYYLSQDTTYSADDFLLTQNTAATSNVVSVLGPSTSSAIMTSQVLLPASLPPTWTGTRFYVVMRTDANNSITESNELNNGGQQGPGRDYFQVTINPLVNPVSGFSITLRLTGMTPAQQAVFQAAANRWAQIIWGDLPNANYVGSGGFASAAVDDILIEGSITPIDGSGGILGQAGPDSFRAGTFLPYHGIMEFDSADVADMIADGSFQSVILHEMGHVLGIGTIWDQRGLLIGGGGADPRFTGVQAVWAHNAITGATDPDVPVENTGGGGTADSHWRESVYGAELMTGYTMGLTVLPLSQLTAASMADLLYQVDISKADVFTIPLRAALGVDKIAASPRKSTWRFMTAEGRVVVVDDEIGGSIDNSMSLAYAMSPLRSGSTATNQSNIGTSSISARVSTVSTSRLTTTLQTAGINGLNQRVVTRQSEAKDSDLFASHKEELESLFASEEVF